jgi:hypothetical protein
MRMKYSGQGRRWSIVCEFSVFSWKVLGVAAVVKQKAAQQTQRGL